MAKEINWEDWEPKVSIMSIKHPVYGIDAEDVKQELRIVLLKAISKFKSGNGSTFQTYFHRCCLNKIYDLRVKEQKQYNIKYRTKWRLVGNEDGEMERVEDRQTEEYWMSVCKFTNSERKLLRQILLNSPTKLEEVEPMWTNKEKFNKAKEGLVCKLRPLLVNG